MNKILKATIEDKEEVLELYRTFLYGLAGWNESYPNEETIDFDLSRDSLFVMKNEKNEIIATISIDQDEAVENLKVWSKELMPGGELSRLCVKKEYQNRGISKEMMKYAFDELINRGKKSVHILVMKANDIAVNAYKPLGYKMVGECQLFDHEYYCMELELI